MPIYQLRCTCGHSFEVIQSFRAPLPACPQCGGETAKVPSVFGIAGQAGRSLPPPLEAMPQTWRGTYEGNHEYVTDLRRTAERRKALEERHPELAGDRRPILAHEGRFERAPLRAGDPVPGAEVSGRSGGSPPSGAAEPGGAPSSGAHGHGGHHHSHRPAGGPGDREARQRKQKRPGSSRSGG
ncbi:MAG: FmdB family zinc ribbon protein [Micromonosporaceae bacterium]